MTTIMAVDDSQTMLNMVRQTLEAGGYQVIVAADGQEGLQKLNETPVQLIITDINMPVMDGLSFIKEIRKSDQETPILTLTTESEDIMQKKGHDAGANGWIIKPFRPAQLLDIIKQILTPPHS
jgi:two-component system chemotaxis response regulator CheY